MTAHRAVRRVERDAPPAELVHWRDADTADAFARARSLWPRVGVHGFVPALVTERDAPVVAEFAAAAECLARHFRRTGTPGGRIGVQSRDLVAYVNRTADRPCSHGAVLLAAGALGAPVLPIQGTFGALLGLAAIDAAEADGAPIVGPRRVRQISDKLRLFVLARDGWTCRNPRHDRRLARTRDEGAVLHVDHVLPVAAGGTDALANLQTLCAACNLAKGAALPVPAPRPRRRKANP